MKSMTYKPKPGMSQRQIKAEVNRQAVLFEEKVRQEQAEKKTMKKIGIVTPWHNTKLLDKTFKALLI